MFLDALVVSGIVKELSKSKILTYLSVIVFPAMISFRATYYTGVYVYHGLIQFCMLFTLLAVYLYIRYRRTEKIRYQVLSCISWFVALGLYEVSYVLCVCFIIALICIDGWDDVYADKNNSAELNELYGKMKKEGFKATYHINNSYTVLADCKDLVLTYDKDRYDYKVYTDSLDIFLYDSTPMVLTCKDANGIM